MPPPYETAMSSRVLTYAAGPVIARAAPHTATKFRPIVSGEEGLRALHAARLITDEIAKSLAAVKA